MCYYLFWAVKLKTKRNKFERFYYMSLKVDVKLKLLATFGQETVKEGTAQQLVPKFRNGDESLEDKKNRTSFFPSLIWT